MFAWVAHIPRRFELNPLTRRRLQRFRSIRRGWWSFWILAFMVLLAALGPWLVNNRAIAVKYKGEWYFPTLGDDLPGTTFGLDYGYETNYRALKDKFTFENEGDLVILPPVPFGPKEYCEVNQRVELRDGKLRMKGATTPLDDTRVFTLHANGGRARIWSVADGLVDGDMQGLNSRGEPAEKGRWENGVRVTHTRLDGSPAPAVDPLAEVARLRTLVVNPAPPGLDRHLLGTDETGHDVLARLFGGFRILIAASLIYMAFTYGIGIAIGCTMGYYGGWFDLLVQRFIEIWSNIPRLYVIIFLSAVIVPNLMWLMLILVAYSWIGMTAYMRTGTYREKGREYVSAARLLGAGDARIIFRHILPNTLSTLVTFVPFSVAEVTAMLTALDFLGFGLPPTEPTWGDLLRQGTENFKAPWILLSVATALVLLMMLVSFVGEAIREAYDPKKHTVYE